MTPTITVETENIEAVNQNTDPLEVRWGFNPTQREKHLNATECGIARVPFARFFPIKHFNTPKEHHSIDWTKPKENVITVTASDVESFVEEALGGKGAQNPVNWGLQVGFLGERDSAKMMVLSYALVPDLSVIRDICRDYDLEQPISDVCEGTDEIEGNRETCATCWNLWLKSEALDRYIEIISKSGMNVTERDAQTGAEKQRVVRPTAAEFAAARELITKAFQIGLQSVGKQWDRISREIEKNQRDDVSPFEHEYRKDLHQSKPQDKQIALIDRFARASANANGTKSNQVQDERISKMAETQEKTVDVLLKLSDRLDRWESAQTATENKKEKK